ncbi:46093_t:CDS:2 [Gigaspora margarita]|uniref:46093_t:CDS:1 n=1 Tax=Gigaspora margarita TaxID=4874 RepID=A0ABN7W0R1_GIGMA|nr:46093_t:CDS:2 [Gigaspora margarita]
MSNKIYEWHKFLQGRAENFEMFFADELLEALDNLSSDEFGIFFYDLEKGINETLNYFEKMVITLASSTFDCLFYHVILQKPWIVPPTDLELHYSEELADDLRNRKKSSFDLRELLLQDNEFLQEFEQFCINTNFLYIIFLDYIILSKLNLFYYYTPATKKLKELEPTEKNIPLQEIQTQMFEPNVASNMFNSLIM